MRTRMLYLILRGVRRRAAAALSAVEWLWSDGTEMQWPDGSRITWS